MPRYTANLVPHLWEVESDTVANGDYDFDVGDKYDPLDMFLDEFRFVDGSGAPAVPTAGTVSVQVSSDGTFWRELNNGAFDATLDTTSAAYTPPSGLTAITKLRIVLAGVTGASGFRGTFVRG